MQAVTNIQSYLYELIEMEEETVNHCKAEAIVEITDHMVSLFGMWNYGKAYHIYGLPGIEKMQRNAFS